MTKIVWDQAGERVYETGVSQGVLYMLNQYGVYDNGVAWNGLTSIAENPTGAEPSAQYADNIKYLNLMSAEEFGATLQAFTYPAEFSQFDGIKEPEPGIQIGQQPRKTFGLAYKTIIGNDASGDQFGYKLHLVYGCMATPSQKTYNTVNNNPEAINFSWTLSTTPVAVSGMKPTSKVTISSVDQVKPGALTALETILYGDTGVNPRLPLPDEVVGLFANSLTFVSPEMPAFNDTDTITIPSTVGVTYYDANGALSAGALVIEADTLITARPSIGYAFNPGVDDDWLFVFAE